LACIHGLLGFGFAGVVDGRGVVPELATEQRRGVETIESLPAYRCRRRGVEFLGAATQRGPEVLAS